MGERLTLAFRHAAGGVRIRGIVEPSLGEADPAAVEKGVDALQPRAPVEERAVVGVGVEGNEVPAGARTHPEQELVENLRPGGCVETRAVGEHAVQVEEARLRRRDQAEHLLAHRHR